MFVVEFFLWGGGGACLCTAHPASVAMVIPLSPKKPEQPAFVDFVNAFTSDLFTV